MEDVTRKRIMRKLDGLPEEQLYQVLDYIEFLELKYARAAGQKPDAFQQFAERLEDQMRVRSLAPKAMKGTMKVMSTAGKVLDGVRELGKDLVTPPERKDASGEAGDRGRPKGTGGGPREGGGRNGSTRASSEAAEADRDGSGSSDDRETG